MPSKSKIRFFFENTKIDLRNRLILKRFIEGMVKKEAKKLGFINYIFCQDKKILEINRHFLKHDFYTDILSFDLSDTDGNIEAEIYISIDRIKENSKTLNIPFNMELLRVIFHGVLHLCGYGDKKRKEKYLMRKKEDFYLTSYRKHVFT